MTRDRHDEDDRRFELAATLQSLFDENCYIRIQKSNSALMGALKVESSCCVLGNGENNDHAIFFDGCAVIWTIYWPKHVTVQSYLNGFQS